MKARPILFCAAMIQALLEGRKTQTRRVIAPQPPADQTFVNRLFAPTALFQWSDEPKPAGSRACVRWPADHGLSCRLGQPGDLLWVRETAVIENTSDYHGDHVMPTDGRPVKTIDDIDHGAYSLIPHYRATEPEPHIVSEDHDADDDHTRWTPSIFMPRWASRLTLRITDVRVQRLQDIDNVDAIDEGVMSLGDEWFQAIFPDYHEAFNRAKANEEKPPIGPSPSVRYAKLWEEINGPGSWAANPYVLAITFDVLQQNVDSVLRQAEAKRPIVHNGTFASEWVW